MTLSWAIRLSRHEFDPRPGSLDCIAGIVSRDARSPFSVGQQPILSNVGTSAFTVLYVLTAICQDWPNGNYCFLTRSTTTACPEFVIYARLQSIHFIG